MIQLFLHAAHDPDGMWLLHGWSTRTAAHLHKLGNVKCIVYCHKHILYLCKSDSTEHISKKQN